MWHYIKFFHYYVTALIGITFMFLGGYFIVLGFLLFIATYVLGDAFLGDDVSEPVLKQKWLIDLLLYSSVPVTILVFLSALWLVSPYEFGFVSRFSEFSGLDLVSAKENTAWWQILIAIPFFGFLISGAATVVAHELVHRVNSKFAVCVGRWLMAFSFDANFSIEHVYNHHAKVATPDDPVTSPRGRHVYSQVIRSFIGTNLSSWEIEKKRLTRKKLDLFSIHNLFIRGVLMSVVLLVIAAVLASWQGVLMFIAIGAMAKFILEVVNYMEHYGLVRDPKKPVCPRHSWNTNKKISCWAMFNLPRHSHHHARASVPFEKLNALPDSPTMISGYISTIGIALIPPLWFKLMEEKLEHWDSNYASDVELEILNKQEKQKPQSFIGKLVY